MVNLQPEESMTLDLVELPTYPEAEVEVMDYTMNQTPEGWESSKKLSFPTKINEDKPVTIVFISRDLP
ncbi:hypothetical protein [Pseudogracilibacillus auburnensis]|uniref:hypothetical protein n=1 Tax=Pseudogracilibacillus auburnensis TaxID=1494959 RepID=UPI001A95C47B|nr:hypothetical protein [Pseudogracilibacillus auburnensis]MBO1006000.1 hypothetical protein [Pseudogracilibacillus auburnensis]